MIQKIFALNKPKLSLLNTGVSAIILQQIKAKLLKQLHMGKYLSDKQSLNQRPSILLVNHSYNHECIVLKVCYGLFQLFITVLFSDDRRSTHQIFSRFGGNFSTVYKACILNRLIAIKCTKYDSLTFIDVFGDVLKQYVIFKILSQLQLGPKMEKSMGFDLIIGPNCIQFCAQFCQHKLGKNDIQNISQDLKQILIRLHSLNIIHGDIKIDNICYSNHHKKYIFIDYGLHRILDQSLGQKTLTSFRGTVGFIISQMQECLVKQSQLFIDLFYNDLFGLKKTLQNIQQEAGLTFQYKQIPGTDITNQIIYVLMKGLLVQNYLISESIVKSKYYQQIITHSKNNICEYQSELLHFQNELKGRNKTVSSLSQLSRLLSSEQNSEQQNQLLNFDFFKRSNQRKSIQKIIIIIKHHPFDRSSLVFDGTIIISEKAILQNYQCCKKLNKPQYFLMISKHIYITGIQRLQQKQKICNCFLKYKLGIQSTDWLLVKRIKLCYLHLIDYSLKNKLATNQDLNIFKLNVISSIASEAFDQDNLLRVMEFSIKLQTTRNRKIRIFLAFLQGVQWVKERFYSKYQSNILLNCLYKRLRQFIDNSKQTNMSKEQYMLIQCLQLLLLPSVCPLKLLKIYQRINSRLYLYHFSTSQTQSALFQVWNLLVITSKIEGLKQSSIILKQKIILEIGSMKLFQIQNNLIVSGIFFTKIDICYQITFDDKPGFSKYLLKKVLIDYLFTMSGLQLKSILDFLSVNQRNSIPKNNHNIFQVINVYIFGKRNTDHYATLLNKLNLDDKKMEFHYGNKGQTLQLLWYGLHVQQFKNKPNNKQQNGIKLHMYSQQTLRQIISFLLSLICQTQEYNHRHQIPFKIKIIMNLLKHYQQENNQSISMLIQVNILQEILSNIRSIQCIICKLYAYSFYNIYRFFMKPNTSACFKDFSQYLIKIVITLAQISPFSSLFSDFLLDLFLLVGQSDHQQNSKLNRQLVLLLFEICKAINSFQLVFTIFLKNLGTKFVTLIDLSIIYLWVDNRREDCYFFIEKVCEYLQKNNSRLISWYFSLSIKFIYKVMLISLDSLACKETLQIIDIII